MYTVACNWHCSIQVELPSVSLGLQPYRGGFMRGSIPASISKYGTVASSSLGA